MNNSILNPKTEQMLTTLTARVTDLVQRCERLAEEKHELQGRCAELQAERQALIEQNEQARDRIDTMVARLKGLE
jgi:cell division protein ZapB